MLKATILDATILEQFGGEQSNTANYFKNDTNKHQFTDEFDYVRKAISDAFKGFLMTKTHDFNEPEYGLYGIYKARIDSDTTGDIRCIVAIVPNDKSPVGATKPLSILKWTSFQTRETYNSKKDFNGLYLEKQRPSYITSPVLNDKIHLIKETKFKYIYKCENLPLKVELLLLKEDDSYSSTGTVWTALQVYSTVLILE